MLNVLTNAIKYQDEGQIDVFVYLKDDREKSQIEVVVRDKGSGIK